MLFIEWLVTLTKYMVYKYIHPLYMDVKHLTCMAYAHFAWHICCDTYLALTCEVKVAVCCVLAYISLGHILT